MARPFLFDRDNFFSHHSCVTTRVRPRVCAAVLAAVLLSAGALRAQGNGVSFIANLNLPHGVSPQGTSFSSCWGYTTPDGREYAFLSTYTGMAVYDINVDSLIEEVAFIPGPQSGYCYREIKTYRHYGYIVYDYPIVAGQLVGIQIVDLQFLPDSVPLVKTFLFPDSFSSANVATSHTVTLFDGFLYCNGSSHWALGGVVIFDLRNDPTSPEYVSAYEPTYIHDSYVRKSTLYGAAVYGGTSGGLYVADVSNPVTPVQLGHIEYYSSGTHNVWVSVDGRYAFTTDEIGATLHDMKVWDLDSLPNSVKVGEWSADPLTTIHNVYGRGNFIYAAHYKAGMRVVDIHDPPNPVEVGMYDTYTPDPDPLPGSYAGCWGVYPYFPSGKWIGSDMQTGLYVCRFDGLKPRRRSRLIVPADSSATPSLQFAWTSAADQAEDPHFYRLYLQSTNHDTVLQTSDTSLTVSGDMPAGVYRWFVTTCDEYNEVSSVDTFTLIRTQISGTDGASGRLPLSTALLQNYPNPFNPVTTIAFDLGSPGEVSLEVYNMLGQRVQTLLERQKLGPGRQEVVLDAGRLPSGVYYYRLATGGAVMVRRMVLCR